MTGMKNCCLGCKELKQTNKQTNKQTDKKTNSLFDQKQDVNLALIVEMI